MFRFIALVIYLLPNIYVYFRIKKLFINDDHKKIFTVFYIIFALAFPIVEVLSHNTSSGWVKYFLLMGYYSVVFLLYLFLFLVLNYIIKNLYELGWGYKKIRQTHFFVTSGIQGWGPPVRTAGNSEIMVINVDFKDK
jgi:hypothetical protein